MPAFYVSNTTCCLQYHPGEMSLGGFPSTSSTGNNQFRHASPELYWRETPYAAGGLFQLGKRWPQAGFSNDRNLGSAAPFVYVSSDEWRVAQFTVLSLNNVVVSGAFSQAYIMG